MILAALIAVVDTALDLAKDHPDVARKLWAEAKEIVGIQDEEAPAPHLEAVRGMVSGLAAARSSAVTTARMRDLKAKAPG